MPEVTNQNTEGPTPEQLVESGLLSMRDAADFLGVSESKLRDLMNGGQLYYLRIGPRRLIPRKSLVTLAAASLRTGPLNR